MVVFSFDIRTDSTGGSVLKRCWIATAHHRLFVNLTKKKKHL